MIDIDRNDRVASHELSVGGDGVRQDIRRAWSRRIEWLVQALQPMPSAMQMSHDRAVWQALATPIPAMGV